MASSTVTLLLIACFGLFVSPVLAFGAGEVPDSSPWDGYVWRHGDITKVLSVLPVSFVTKYAFTKMQVRQVYFGNWLRDYSQLLDTKLISEVHESVLRGIVSVLGFMEFGLATDEFDVTKERLGVYRHEHHIDNPFGYDTDLPGKDASKIDRRLRGPVRPEELEIDANTGMKNYIANSGKGWITAADYVKEQLHRCIQHGRGGNMNEAFIHLGAAMHTLEDFAAHSNYTELVLLEIGVDGVFPFVGDACRVQAPGTNRAVPPITTGTFGALDILHSLLGEADDKVAVLNEGMEDISGSADLGNLENVCVPDKSLICSKKLTSSNRNLLQEALHLIRSSQFSKWPWNHLLRSQVTQRTSKRRLMRFSGLPKMLLLAQPNTIRLTVPSPCQTYGRPSNLYSSSTTMFRSG
jgi:hypothetical protein